MIIEQKDDYTIDLDTLPPALRPVAEEMQKFVQKRNVYHSAIREVSTKLEILDDEFHVRNDHNPIHHMESRVKSVQSIFKKIQKKGWDVSTESIGKITDIAGIRVICNYLDDVYKISEMLLRQDDIELIREKDYIAHPKESGYRSLHLVVLVPVFLADHTERIPVEVQIRTIAMDTWASLEHELKYKNENGISEEAAADLKNIANVISDLDQRMLKIHENEGNKVEV